MENETICPYCQSTDVEFQYIRKGMTIQSTLLFLGLLCGGITIPVAIWLMYDANKLRLYCVCKHCKKIWETEV